MDLTTRYLISHVIVGALIVAGLLWFYGGVKDLQFIAAFAFIYMIGLVVVDKIGLLEKLTEYVK